MQILKIYDGKTRQYPSGKLATAEVVYNDYPAVQVFAHVISTDESDQIIFSINNLSAMRTMHNIPSNLSNEDAILAIQDILNAPSPPTDPTAEERTAAALEFLAMASMPDETI